jgi:hypothetical protein
VLPPSSRSKNKKVRILQAEKTSDTHSSSVFTNGVRRRLVLRAPLTVGGQMYVPARESPGCALEINLSTDTDGGRREREVGENALLKLISVLRINEPRFSKYDFLELQSPEEEREDKTRQDRCNISKSLLERKVKTFLHRSLGTR